MNLIRGLKKNERKCTVLENLSFGKNDSFYIMILWYLKNNRYKKEAKKREWEIFLLIYIMPCSKYSFFDKDFTLFNRFDRRYRWKKNGINKKNLQDKVT